MVGTSRKMTKVREYLTEVVGFNSHVLITGETGTGKELAAAMVHEQGLRAIHPFICVNCAAIPEALFASEVFGYEKGVFYRGQYEMCGSVCRGKWRYRISR